MLLKRMEECVDGEYQDFKSKNGAYVREHFFGKYPETAGDGRRTCPTTRSGRWRAAATIRTRSTPPTTPLCAARASPPSSWPRPSRATAWARPAKGRTSPTSRRRWARRNLREFRDRFDLPITDEQLAKVPFLRFPEGSTEARVPARATRGAGRLSAGAPAKSTSAGGAAAVGVRRPAQGHRRAQDLHHDGLRADPQHAAARQGDRQARRADRARREPHLRHGGHVPPVRHLQPGRPALSAGGRQPADVLQGGPEGPDPAGRHQRGRRDVVLDRGGDVVTAATTCR